MTQDTILLDILAERFRQERLCRAGKFPHTLASPSLSPAECLAVLAEEFGEVARPVADALASGSKPDQEALRSELVQLAACCVAWLEQLDGVVGGGVQPYRDSELPRPPQGPAVAPPSSASPSYAPPMPPAEYSPAWLDMLPDYGGAL